MLENRTQCANKSLPNDSLCALHRQLENARNTTVDETNRNTTTNPSGQPVPEQVANPYIKKPN